MANLIKRENREASRTQEYRVDPFRVVDALLRWDPFRSDWSGSSAGGDLAPRFDVKETKDAYVIKADLPGFRDDKVEVLLNGNLLTVKGEREEEHREEGEQFYAMERSTGSFARSFSLPDSVDADSVRADLKNGVLTVNVPKRPEAQPKKIAIGRSDGDGKTKS